MLSVLGSPCSLLVVPSCVQDYELNPTCFHEDTERTSEATPGEVTLALAPALPVSPLFRGGVFKELPGALNSR